ncbi:DNA-directed RNA polymerase [Actinidia chinensis var. chinensis]|uniref:DNA-directed RNA polymerase n=1 Tax=Actinidia chinensis var. chinensis TaxID=1590841 RepID=A0A2R6RWX4_ACTCC|nr:DNA-directed RNA polymerase [Actinidia chinensis var. chinensis]
MERKEKSGASFFQMPLHYPRYTMNDYHIMPEAKLDTLLAEYGLTVHGDLAYKREFAMGAFLWPNHLAQPPRHNVSTTHHSVSMS